MKLLTLHKIDVELHNDDLPARLKVGRRERRREMKVARSVEISESRYG
jgi:hypothetical protein